MPADPVQFTILMLVSLYVITVIHELAHAVAGALAGLHVASCGIGYSKPLIRFRLFGVVFYQTWSPFGGMTLTYDERIFEATRATTFVIAAGPLSDFLVTLSLFGLWHTGVDQVWLLPAFCSAVFCLLMDTIPISVRFGGATLENDGRQLLNRLRGRAFHDLILPGEHLKSSLFLRDFFQNLDVWPGAVHFTLNAAFYQAMLSDYEGARATLQHECLKDLRRVQFLNSFEAYVRACTAVAAEAEDAEAEIAAAAALCGDTAVGQAALKLLQAQLAVARGNASRQLIQEVIELSRRARLELVALGAEVLQLESEPPEDPLEACRRLQESFKRIGNPALPRLALAAQTACQLAEIGRFEDARAPFHEATARLKEIAATIPLDETRRRFICRASKPLRDAVLRSADTDIPPIYLPSDPKPASRQRSAQGLRAWSGFLAAGIIIGLLAAVVNDLRQQSVPSVDLGSIVFQLQARQSSEEAELLSDILRNFRDGDRERALEQLEERLDESVLHLANISELSREWVPESATEALRAVRDYRKSHPRTTGDSDLDARLKAALSLAVQTGPFSHEPLSPSPPAVMFDSRESPQDSPASLSRGR